MVLVNKVQFALIDSINSALQLQLDLKTITSNPRNDDKIPNVSCLGKMNNIGYKILGLDQFIF